MWRSDVGLCSRPSAISHRFNHRSWRKVVEVAGGGGDGGVAELFGDDADVHAFGAELRGVGVTKSVRMDTLVDTGPGGQAFEQPPDVSVGHWFSAERAEHGMVTVQAQLRPRVQPSLDDGGGAGVQAHGARLPAFAVEHADATVIQVQVFRIEAQRLVDAHARTVQQRDQRSVAQAGRRVSATHMHERADLDIAKNLRRQAAPGLNGHWAARPRSVLSSFHFRGQH